MNCSNRLANRTIIVRGQFSYPTEEVVNGYWKCAFDGPERKECCPHFVPLGETCKFGMNAKNEITDECFCVAARSTPIHAELAKEGKP